MRCFIMFETILMFLFSCKTCLLNLCQNHIKKIFLNLISLQDRTIKVFLTTLLRSNTSRKAIGDKRHVTGNAYTVRPLFDSSTRKAFYKCSLARHILVVVSKFIACKKARLRNGNAAFVQRVTLYRDAVNERGCFFNRNQTET